MSMEAGTKAGTLLFVLFVAVCFTVGYIVVLEIEDYLERRKGGHRL